MKRKSKLISLIIIIIGVVAGAWWWTNSKSLPLTTKRDKFVIGTEASFRPFEYRVGQKIVGFDIDLAQMVADDLDRDLVIEEMSFDGLIPALKAGKVDGIVAGLTITPDRAKSVDFSDGYYSASQKIVVKKDSPITKQADLVGKKVGVQLGTTGDTLMTEMTGVKTVQFPAVPAVLQELSHGRLDAVVIDGDPARLYLKNFPDLKIIDQDLSQEEYAIAINKGQPEMLAKINQTIRDIKLDGRYDQLITKYFSGDDALEKAQPTYWQRLHFIFIKDHRYMYLVRGLGITVALASAAVVMGVIIGLIVALMIISKFYPLRSRSQKNSRWYNFNPLRTIGNFYVTVIRGTPVLVQLLIMYYVVFGSYTAAPKLVVAAIAFGVNSGAYVAEILRSSIQGIDIGQTEAAESLGLSYPVTMTHIILPQALRTALPTLASEFITLLKETSVVGWIGASDLMRGADNIRFQTATAFESLMAAALIYLLMTSIFKGLTGKLERKVKEGD